MSAHNACTTSSFHRILCRYLFLICHALSNEMVKKKRPRPNTDDDITDVQYKKNRIRFMDLWPYDLLCGNYELSGTKRIWDWENGAC